MKKFEEELKDNNLEILVSNTGSSLYGQSYLNYDAVVELSKGWVSPEDYEKYIKESTDNTSKLLGKINDLKSQLEKQQPEIPEFVAAAIEAKNHIYGDFRRTANITHYSEDVRHWYYAKPYHAELFYRAILDGYTVAKEKRFYLKHELTGQFLAKRNQKSEHQKYFFWTGENPLTHSIGTAWELKFTQSEIDSMETGSYEQIPVEEK